jgi:hypothetical protein
MSACWHQAEAIGELDSKFGRKLCAPPNRVTQFDEPSDIHVVLLSRVIKFVTIYPADLIQLLFSEVELLRSLKGGFSGARRPEFDDDDCSSRVP